MNAIGHALQIAGSMAWEITWALILGFGLSSVVQALIPKDVIVRLLGDDRPRTLAVAAGLGAASSSCSYAAVALARSLLRKGASFTAAMAFEIASTNLVVELGVILALLLGWQFTAAEFSGGPIMIIGVAVMFRLFVRQRLLDAARAQADRGLAGSMEGHAAMDMSVAGRGSVARKLASGDGLTAVSHVFVMEWAAVLRDLLIGLLIAGAIAAWVPAHFWRVFFITGHPVAAALWGPVIGPVVSLLSFVCSIGNVPLAAVLWKDGLSFGGVTAFIFADLLILPILNIYRKYYGAKMAAVLLATFYAAMVVAGYAVEGIFSGLGITPARSGATIPDSGVTWNYTTWLNIVFLLAAAVLLIRFTRTGGIAMLRMMGGPADADHSAHGHDHATHDHATHDHATHDHGPHDHGPRNHGGHDHAAHDHHDAHDHHGDQPPDQGADDHATHDHGPHDHTPTAGGPR
ncbi:MAG TPA: permease [Streptosporangiaceae bacterium]|nr:permease [Streptosporangiaceae bacterium]